MKLLPSFSWWIRMRSVFFPITQTQTKCATPSLLCREYRQALRASLCGLPESQPPTGQQTQGPVSPVHFLEPQLWRTDFSWWWHQELQLQQQPGHQNHHPWLQVRERRALWLGFHWWIKHSPSIPKHWVGWHATACVTSLSSQQSGWMKNNS